MSAAKDCLLPVRLRLTEYLVRMIFLNFFNLGSSPEDESLNVYSSGLHYEPPA